MNVVGGSACPSGLNPPGVQMSPEEQAKCLALRKNVYRKYRILSMTTAALSVVSITIGIVILVLAQGGSFPVVSGAPIWSAIVILIGSGFGMAAGMSDPDWKTESDKNKQRCYVIVYYVMAVTSFSGIGLCIGYSAWSLTACAQKDDDSTCPTNFDALVALNAVVMVIGFIFFICSLFVAIMFCYYRKAFHFQSRHERAAVLERTLIEQQRQIAILQQQQNATQQQMGFSPPQYQQAQNQGYGYGGTQYTNAGTGNETKYSSSPPPSYYDSTSSNKH